VLQTDSRTVHGERVNVALVRANLGQRALARATGIAQTRLSRIISGAVEPKLPELILIAEATGTTLAELTGVECVSDRAQSAARATDGAGMEEMRRELIAYLELDAYLDDQAICSPR
jgi:transcriptional regulator with XRE-family HTH domain